MDCRTGCAACCIVISITSPIPGMPEGKPAGVRCVQLTPENKCLLFGRPERPVVCLGFQADEEVCGATDREAFANLERLENITRPPTESSD